MAIYFKRTGEIAQGKLEDAMHWAVKVAEHVNHTVPDAKLEVLDNLAGNYDEVHWIMRTESLAQFETVMTALEKDQKYGALIREATKGELFTAVFDELYRVVG